MADWSRAYSATWRVRRVDPATWESVEEVAGITSVAISRSSTDALESADLQISTVGTGGVRGGWVRVEAEIEQGGEFEVVPIATVLLADGTDTFSRGWRTTSAKGLSVLWPATKRHFLRGQTAPKGTDGAAWCAEQLRACIAAPVSADGSFKLSDHVVFKSGQTILSGVWQVLDAAGWRLRVNGRGEVSVCAPATDTALDVTPSNVMDGIELDAALTDVPNVYVAIEGTRAHYARNTDPSSPTSTVSRGYVVEQVDAAPKRIDGESFEGYAERKLTELRTQVVREYSWTRDFAPDVVPGDLVRARIPSAGIDGALRVTSQTLDCKNGLVVSETAALEGVV